MMKPRHCQLDVIILGTLGLLTFSLASGSTQVTAGEGDAYTILSCNYKNPIQAYTRTTIEWSKHSPDIPFGLTLVHLTDFNVRGIADERYGATPKGELVIQNVSLADQGSYRCLVVFRLKEPNNDNGYITLQHVVELKITNSHVMLDVYPKTDGPETTHEKAFSVVDGKAVTIVCTTTNNDYVQLQWFTDHQSSVDNITTHTTRRSHAGHDGLMVTSVSEFTFIPSKDSTGSRPLTLSCTAKGSQTEVIESKELVIQLNTEEDEPIRGKAKKRQRNRDGKKKNNRRTKKRGKKCKNTEVKRRRHR